MGVEEVTNLFLWRHEHAGAGLETDGAGSGRRVSYLSMSVYVWKGRHGGVLCVSTVCEVPQAADHEMSLGKPVWGTRCRSKSCLEALCA